MKKIGLTAIQKKNITWIIKVRKNRKKREICLIYMSNLFLINYDIVAISGLSLHLFPEIHLELTLLLARDRNLLYNI